jgi:hypothetical protein
MEQQDQFVSVAYRLTDTTVPAVDESQGGHVKSTRRYTHIHNSDLTLRQTKEHQNVLSRVFHKLLW